MKFSDTHVIYVPYIDANTQAMMEDQYPGIMQTFDMHPIDTESAAIQHGKNVFFRTQDNSDIVIDSAYADKRDGYWEVTISAS